MFMFIEKGVVGELGLGFNDHNTGNDGIDDLISALNGLYLNLISTLNPISKILFFRCHFKSCQKDSSSNINHSNSKCSSQSQ